MDIIYKKTGVTYHEVHIYRLLHKWGFSAKVPQKRFVNTASKEERVLQKGVQGLLLQIPKGFAIAVHRMNQYLYDITVRRKLWLPKGIRPIVTVTGSYQRTCVFGTLTMEGNNYFASIISLTKTLSLII